jgi:GT2 family glycosyltransferase
VFQFSFLLPTRGRVDSLGRFLTSVRETARAPEAIEVVLVVDEDDPDSHHVSFEGLAVKTVIVPPGASMGELNRAAFAASSGRYVMLINDDVVVRTRYWDREVSNAFASLGDDVGLIHTNDLLFREKLCTFPVLSRIACQRIGVCPPEYRRYRIDDHITDTYNILGYLGHPRILYLGDVVFEHLNHQEKADGGAAEIFESEDQKVYQPNQEILAVDARRFDECLEQRKADALALAELISESVRVRSQAACHQRVQLVDRPLVDRRGEFTRALSPSSMTKPLEQASVTIAVVTAGLEQPHARECIHRIKTHSGHAELIVLDNNRSAHFNHPREMNRILDAAKTDYAVLLDDDVFVDERWLDGLLRGVDADAGVVGPIHRGRDGVVSHSGVYLAGDDWGNHAHLIDVPSQPRVVPMLCSACLLVDLRKCGHVRFNEAYSKYFLDLDYSLRVWETGYKVVCSPFSTVTHLAGVTMPHGSSNSLQLWERDIVTFRQDWILNGRLERVERDFMSRYPFLLHLQSVPHQIVAAMRNDADEDVEQVVDDLLGSTKDYSLFQSLLLDELNAALARAKAHGDVGRERCFRRALEQLDGVASLASMGRPMPILLERYGPYNLARYGSDFLAIPISLGQIDLRIDSQRTQPGILPGKSVEDVKRRIADLIGTHVAEIAPVAMPNPQLSQPLQFPTQPPVLIQEGYRGFNLIRWSGRYYAIPQGEGEFTPEAVVGKRFTRAFDADTLSMLKVEVDRRGGASLSRAARRLGGLIYRMAWPRQIERK